jgi:ribosome recycling factor
MSSSTTLRSFALQTSRRHAAPPQLIASLASRSALFTPLAHRLPARAYASKAKGAKASKDLVPGSQIFTTDQAVLDEHARAEQKMKTAVDWFRKEAAGYEVRASGRVTPALLSPVRVELPSRKGESVRLEEVATVGVREGSTLLITVFEEEVRLWPTRGPAVERDVAYR